MRSKCLILVCVLFIVACKPNKQIAATMEVENNATESMVNKPTIVYKTTKDFSDFVAVIMNTERTKIVSYPAPTDLSLNSKPTKLKNGYLLDNRGISENTVFLNYSYEVYINLKTAPSLAEMQKNILEKYPLTEMFLCGSRYSFKDEVSELNALIDARFKGCKKIDIVAMGVILEL
jgi:hypothetical protein